MSLERVDRMPKIIHFDEFRMQRGVPKIPFGEDLHRLPGHTRATKRRVDREMLRRCEEHRIQVEELHAEYDRLIAIGEIKSPTHKERIQHNAGGLPENESTKAAKRVLERRKSTVGE